MALAWCPTRRKPTGSIMQDALVESAVASAMRSRAWRRVEDSHKPAVGTQPRSRVGASLIPEVKPLTDTTSVEWIPLEFTQEALKREHPFRSRAVLPERTLRAIFWNLTASDQEKRAHRFKMLEVWGRRAADLDAEEHRRWSEAPPTVQPCWRGKRTLLMAEMAKEAGVPAAELVAECLRHGALVVGEVPACGLFEFVDEKPESPFWMS